MLFSFSFAEMMEDLSDFQELQEETAYEEKQGTPPSEN